MTSSQTTTPAIEFGECFDHPDLDEVFNIKAVVRGGCTNMVSSWMQTCMGGSKRGESVRYQTEEYGVELVARW
jgi:hypothetical protein